MREPSKKTLRLKCDKLWRDCVKMRDGYTCQYCLKKYPEKSQGLHAHHIFTRTKMNIRHSLINGVSLCYGHHSYAQSHPHDFKDWLIKKKGEKWWWDLRLQGNIPNKLRKDYKLILLYLEEKLKELKWLSCWRFAVCGVLLTGGSAYLFILETKTNVGTETIILELSEWLLV